MQHNRTFGKLLGHDLTVGKHTAGTENTVELDWVTQKHSQTSQNDF